MAVTVAAKAEAELAVTRPLSTVLDVAATVLAAATGAVVLAGMAALTCATAEIDEASTCFEACVFLPMLPASVATACRAALRANRLAAVLSAGFDVEAAGAMSAAGTCVPWLASVAEALLVTSV
jgi:F420-0:gamma-glutamyl ligase